jgi:hypothetical protein
MMLDMAFFGNGVRLQAANQLSGLYTHKGRLLAVDDFSSWQANWVVEAEQSSWISYREEDSLLDLVAEKGLTLWYKKPFSGNLSISYEAYAVQQGGPYDRVSDLNCFWMAVDPCHPDDLFVERHFVKVFSDDIIVWYCITWVMEAIKIRLPVSESTMVNGLHLLRKANVLPF